jgi:hypothetical protein
MRVLCGIGFAKEIGRFTYGSTAVTGHMCSASTAASIIHLYVLLACKLENNSVLTSRASFDQGFPSIAQLPHYFEAHGYTSPNDYLAGPFQYGHNTDMETYSYWMTKPSVISNFNVFMQGGKLKKTRPWTGMFCFVR